MRRSVNICKFECQLGDRHVQHVMCVSHSRTNQLKVGVSASTRISAENDDAPNNGELSRDISRISA